MELTKEIIQRCHDLNYNDLSDDIIDRTRYLLLDYIGVAARGSLSDSSIPMLRLVQDLDKTAEGAVVIGTNIRVSPPLAAMAAAQLAGCTGKEFLAAIVIGYEVTIKLGIALDPAAHYARGFHPTGTCGTMGAAVTAAKILGLNQRAMTNALGIAGSMAAGSMEFLSDGAFTKRLGPLTAG